MAQVSGRLVTRKYSNFKGLDVREGEILGVAGVRILQKIGFEFECC